MPVIPSGEFMRRSLVVALATILAVGCNTFAESVDQSSKLLNRSTIRMKVGSTADDFKGHDKMPTRGRLQSEDVRPATALDRLQYIDLTCWICDTDCGR